MANQKKNQKVNKEEQAMVNNVINEEEKAMQENAINENITPENEAKETVNTENESAQAGETVNDEQAVETVKENAEIEKEKRAPLFTENLLLSCWAICDNEEFKQKPVEKQRKIAQSVIERNNVLLRNYDTLLEHYKSHAPRSYERALWTVHVLLPNRERVITEINRAKAFILNTYSKLSIDDLEKVNAYIKENNPAPYILGRINSSINDSKKALTEYIIINDSYSVENVVEIFAGAGVSGLIIAGNITKQARLILKENGYKYEDDYEKAAETVEGLGNVTSIEGMLYIKK